MKENKNPQKWKKALIITSSLFLILFVTIFVLAKTGILVRQFKDIIQTEISKALNREVTIESIEGGIFDNITLNRVRIAYRKELKHGTLIVIEKLTINYSLSDVIFKRKQVIESIKSINIKKPSILIENTKEGSWNIIEFIESFKTTKQASLPLKCKVSVSRGLISFKDNIRQFNSTIKNIYGDISFTDNSVLLSFEGKSFSSKKTNIRASGRVNLNDNKYSFKVDGLNVNLPHYANYITGYFWKRDTLNFTSGDVNFSFDIEDSVSGNIFVKDGSLNVKILNYGFTNITSELRLENNVIYVNKFSSLFKKTSLTLKGKISDFNNPEYDLNIYVNNINLQDLANLEVLKNLNLSGTGYYAFSIKGRYPDITVLSTCDFKNVKITEFTLNKVKSILKYENNILRILQCNIDAFEGINNFSGEINFTNKKIMFNGDSTDISLYKFFSNLKFYDIRGRVNLTHQISGKLDNFIFKTKAELKDVFIKDAELGKMSADLTLVDNNKLKVVLTDSGKLTSSAVFTIFREKTEVTARVKFNGSDFKNVFSMFVKNKFVLRGATYGTFDISGRLDAPVVLGEATIKKFNFENYLASSAKVSLSLRENVLEVKNLEFFQDEKGKVKASGTLGLSGDLPLNIIVESNDIEVQKLPVVKELYDNINGRSSISGQILGSISHPKFVVNINSSHLTINVQDTVKFACGFVYENYLMTINSISIDEEYNFSGSIKFALTKEVNADLVVKNGKITTLLSLFKIKYKHEEVKGNFYSNIVFKGKINELAGYGSISLKEGIIFNEQIDSLMINFSIKNSNFKIEKCELLQKERNISVNGIVSLKENKQSNLDFQINSRIEDLLINGEYQLTCKLNTKSEVIKGEVKSINLFINNEKLSNLSFNAEYNKHTRNFVVDSIKCDKVRGNAEINISSSRFLSTLSFSGLDINKVSYLNKYLKDENLKGFIYGDMKLSGEKNILNIVNNLKIMKFQFRDLKEVNITSNFSIQKESNKYLININKCRFSQESGNVEITGELNFNDKISMETGESNLDIFLSNADIREVINLFKFKLNIDGRIISLPNISMNGKLTVPVITGDIKLQDVKYEDQLLGDIGGKFTYEKNQLNFSKIIFTDRFNNEIGFDNVNESGRLMLNFTKNAVEPDILCKASFNNLLGLKINTIIDYKGKITLGDKPFINGKVVLNALSMNTYKIGDIKFSFHQEKDEIKFYEDQESPYSVSGKVNLLQDETIFENLKFKIAQRGNILLKGNLSKDSNLDIDIKNTDVQLILGYLNTDFKMTGTISAFSSKLKGDSKAPIYISDGVIENAELFNLKFDLININMEYKDNKLIFVRDKIADRDLNYGVYKEKNIEKYRITLNGFIPFKEQREINLNVNIKDGDLKLIMITKWFKKVEGRMNANFLVSGTISYPEVNGYMIIEDGAVVYPIALVKEINDIRANFNIVKNNVKLVYCAGKVDGSPIEATGSFTLKKFYPDKINEIKIKTSRISNKKGIKFFIASMMQKEGYATIKGFDKDEYFLINGTAPNIGLNGEIYVYDTEFTYPPDIREDNKTSIKILKEMIWNLRVIIKDNVWYYNNYCRVKLKNDGELKFIGPGSDLTLRGKVDGESGKFNYSIGRFDVVKATFKFLETEKRKPAVSAVGETTKQKDRQLYKITVTVSGKEGEYGDLYDKNNLDIKLSAEPNLSQREISMLLTGLPELTLESLRTELINKTLVRTAITAIGTAISAGPIEHIVDVSLDFRHDLMPSDPNLASDVLQGLEIRFNKPLSRYLSVYYSNIYRGNDLGINPGAGGWEQELGLIIKNERGQQLNTRFSDREFYIGLSATQYFDSIINNKEKERK